jgi:hypothetical protein
LVAWTNELAFKAERPGDSRVASSFPRSVSDPVDFCGVDSWCICSLCWCIKTQMPRTRLVSSVIGRCYSLSLGTSSFTLPFSGRGGEMSTGDLTPLSACVTPEEG